jgi:hypothetical protein
MTESEKFAEWHRTEVQKGLIDVKCFPGNGMSSDSANSEGFFRELNLVNQLYVEGKFVSRPDVF